MQKSFCPSTRQEISVRRSIEGHEIIPEDGTAQAATMILPDNILMDRMKEFGSNDFGLVNGDTAGFHHRMRIEISLL
jgi:hypothetical protein